MTKNIFWHRGRITRRERAKLLNSPNRVIWLTGLSGSGKSTIAFALEKELYGRGIPSYVLDGDNIRHGLNSDLGFSPDERKENIRRVGEVARLLYDAGLTVIVAFISPYRRDRNTVRKAIGKDFIEVFVDCPIAECKRRDTKGLYKKAEKGELSGLTGIDAPYEKSESPELVLDSSRLSVGECVQRIIKLINRQNPPQRPSGSP